MDETHPLHPKSTYAVTKLAGEKHCLTLHEWHNYPVAAIRNFNTFGENQNIAFYPAVIPHFIRLALLGEPLPIHGSGNQNRDFLYVGDAARAYAMALEQAARIHGQVFNIGSGQTHSIREIAAAIIEETGSPSRLAPAPGRGRGDLPGLCADTTRIRKALGWEPQVPMREALARTVKWYSKHLGNPCWSPAARALSAAGSSNT